MTRTVDEALQDALQRFEGRTRYLGQEPRDDELIVAELQRLRTECEALRADAERYRYWRDNLFKFYTNLRVPSHEIDALVDEKMKRI